VRRSDTAAPLRLPYCGDVAILTYALAEWQVVGVRLGRTRLGLWLALLAASGALLAARRPDADPAGPAARLGLLAGLLAVAFAGGATPDRSALRATLLHPVTPAALIAGRALALAALATTSVVGGTAGLGALASVSVAALATAALGGAAAAAAAVGAGLAATWVGGPTCGALLFGYVALVSGIPPEVWSAVVAVEPVRSLGRLALVILPGLWRYRALAAGDLVAWAHAVAWALGGAALASWRLERGRR